MNAVSHVVSIDAMKPYVKKLINNYDVTDIYDDHVIFYGVELNSMVDTDINFRFCDRVVVRKNDEKIKFEIYQEKNSNAIIMEVV